MLIFENVPQPPPVEDHFGDILAKAQVGLGLGNRELAERLDCDTDVLRGWHRGKWHPEHATLFRQATELLGLDVDKHRAFVQPPPLPEARRLDGLAAFNLPFGSDMTVNAYLIYEPKGGQTVLIDTGTTAQPMLEWLRTHQRKLNAILLTHAHSDHTGGLEQLRQAFPDCPVFAHPAEDVPGETLPLTPEVPLQTGTLRFLPHHIPGHSPGGCALAIEGIGHPVIATGDALFAGSVGGMRTDYPAGLKRIREVILSQPAETLLLPGHGPASCVARELAWNSFFPESANPQASNPGLFPCQKQ